MKHLLFILLLLPIILFGQSSDLVQVTQASGAVITVSLNETRVITPNPDGTSKLLYSDAFTEFNVAEPLTYFRDTSCNLFIEGNFNQGSPILINKRGVNRVYANGQGKCVVEMINGRYRYVLLQSYVVIKPQLLVSSDCGDGSGGGAGYWTDHGLGLAPTDINKRIGIGVTAPLAPLDIQGSATAGLRIRNSLGAGGYEFQFVSNAARIEMRDATAVVDIILDTNGESLFNGGRMRFGKYGVGTYTATAQSKTQAPYVLAPATDGTVLELPLDSLSNLLPTNLTKGQGVIQDTTFSDTGTDAIIQRDLQFATPPTSPTTRQKTSIYYASDTIPHIYDVRRDTFLKYEKLLTVEDYGAVGDSITADQAAFAAMVADVGHIRMTKGAKYFWSAGITISTVGVDVFGNGSTIIMNSSASSQTIFQVEADSFYIENITFQSLNDQTNTSNASTLSSNIQAIAIQSAFYLEYIKVENCVFNNMGFGVKINQCTDVEIKNNRFIDCSMSMLLQQDTNLIIESNYSDRSFYDPAESLIHHIYTIDGFNTAIKNCYFKGGAGLSINVQQGIDNGATGGYLIADCVFDNTNTTWVSGPDYITITDCNFISTQAVTVQSANSVTFNNPTWYNPDSTVIPFITSQINADSTVFTVNGGTVTGATTVQSANLPTTIMNGVSFVDPYDLTATVAVFPVGGLNNVINKLYVNNCSFKINDVGTGNNKAIFETERSMRVYVTNTEFIETTATTNLFIAKADGNGYITFDNCKIQGFERLQASFRPTKNVYAYSNNIYIDTKDAFFDVEQTKTGAYTTRGESTIYITSGNTLTIDSDDIARTNGHELTVINSSGSGTVTIATEGAELINGQSTFTLTTSGIFKMNGASVDVISAGTSNNYANTNLTANNNRSHVWGAFNQTETYTTGNFTIANTGSASSFIVNGTTGKIGLGIAPSTPKLYIFDNSASDLDLKIENTNASASVRFILKANAARFAEMRFEDASLAGRIFYHFGSDYMSFEANAVERMRITSAGNITLSKYASTYTNDEAPTNIAWFDEATGQVQKSDIDSLQSVLNNISQGVVKDTISGNELDRDLQFTTVPTSPTLRQKTTGFYPSDTILRVYDPRMTDFVMFKTILSVEDYNAIGDGATNDYQSFFDANAAGGVRVLDKNYLIDTDLTITNPLHFLGVGYITIGAGVTLTVQAEIFAGNRYIFRGTGTLVIDYPIKEVNVQWFGATGDGVTDDSQAIQDACNAQYNNDAGRVYLPATDNSYLINKVYLNSGIVMYGDGDTEDQLGILGRTLVEVSSGGLGLIVGDSIYGATRRTTGVEIYKLRIEGKANAVSGIRLGSDSSFITPENVYIHDLTIDGFTDAAAVQPVYDNSTPAYGSLDANYYGTWSFTGACAMFIAGTVHGSFRNVHFLNSYYGIGESGGGFVTTLAFSSCHIKANTYGCRMYSAKGVVFDQRTIFESNTNEAFIMEITSSINGSIDGGAGDISFLGAYFEANNTSGYTMKVTNTTSVEAKKYTLDYTVLKFGKNGFYFDNCDDIYLYDKGGINMTVTDTLLYTRNSEYIYFFGRITLGVFDIDNKTVVESSLKQAEGRVLSGAGGTATNRTAKGTTLVTTQEELATLTAWQSTNAISQYDRGMLEIDIFGEFAASANTKTLTIKIGTTTLITNSTITAPNGVDWHCQIKVIRYDVDNALIMTTLFIGNQIEAVSYSQMNPFWASSQIVYVYGQNAIAETNGVLHRCSFSKWASSLN